MINTYSKTSFKLSKVILRKRNQMKFSELTPDLFADIMGEVKKFLQKNLKIGKETK